MNSYFKKNNVFSPLKTALFSLILTACTIKQSIAQHRISPAAQISDLKTGFLTIPDTIQTTVYWYWLCDNISKQGVIKDLEAMKKVGINRAFIGNIAFDGIPYGKVKMFSDEWWDILHTALKTAGQLGIEIGIFNSPGWSQSGGPWVKPEQSMRYLTSTEILVKGPVTLNKELTKPGSQFQDVSVIAYPAPKNYNTDIRDLKLKLTAIPHLENINNLVDRNEQTLVNFENTKSFILDFTTKKKYTARSLVIYSAPRPTFLEGDIQVMKNGNFQTIKHFLVDRSNNALNVGFNPYGPAAISISATTAKEFRIVFTRVSANSGIAEIKFSSTPVVENYMEKTLAKMWQDPYPYWSAYQWLPQPIINDNAYLINPSQVRDISKYMSPDGTINWKVPAGNWIIERSGMISTGVKNTPAPKEGAGLEIDKMSKKHVYSHFDAFLGEIIKRIPAQDRKTWKVVVEDSYETGGQNWSDNQKEKFKLSFGYDPTPYIPVVQGKVVGSTDQSDRFLWDLRRFIADNLAYEYVAGLREISHKHGLTTWLENYGHWGFPGEFLQYGGQSDEISGEFWNEGTIGDIENRAASSAAHIYGKNKVSAESFTSGAPAYLRYPAMMKQRADRFFTEGINNTLLHVYLHQPYDQLPGIHAWFGNEFNRLNTWFFDMDIFIKYLKRCNLLLQQGKYVADVAYFIGEDAPKMTGVQDPILPNGYSFDYINAEVIKTRMTVKNGRLLLPDGMNYQILVLPKLETIRPELLLKIKELVYDGAIVMGPKPARSPSLQNYEKADQQVKQIADQLWGNINGTTIKVNHFGKGRVIDGMSLEDALKINHVIPDLKTNPSDSVLFIHRELSEGSIYFISNQKNQSIAIKPEFRVCGKVPELWDANTGNTRDLPDYEQTNATTSVPLKLEAFESTFIVFKNASNKSGKEDLKPLKLNYPEVTKTIMITGDWQVQFDKTMRGPVNPIIFKQLEDWAINKNDSIKYYSGTAYYRNTFSLDKIKKNEQVLLDLGSISVIAKVRLNGIEVGGVWTPPYQLDITNALKAGNNDLEIKVVNTWINRIVGDSKLPVDRRKTTMYYRWYDADTRLRASGLKGPVKILITKASQIK